MNMRATLGIGLLALLVGCRETSSASERQPASTSGGSGGGSAGVYGGGASGSDPAPPPDGPTVTVNPVELDDILYNPGMGFAEFHGYIPPESEHPASTVAYWRWNWAELEPSEGQYDFAAVEAALDEAMAKGQTLAFRVMTHWQESTPQWLLDKGVGSVTVPDGAFPDHNDQTFLDHHQKLIQALGNKYAGRAEIDHVDIGSVGCWGEWNTACCEDWQQGTCESYFPTDDVQKTIVDWYFDYFPNTLLVALVGGQASYSVSQGSGWRGDCYGDYRDGWNHMEDLYQATSEDPIVGSAWKTAPVQFEVCGVMQDWYDAGYDIDLILAKGLEWHMSVLNAKSHAVPADWRPKVDEFLKRVGYRMVLVELRHTAEARPGESLLLDSVWNNRGVAPIYRSWPLAYRLRSSSGEIVASWESAVDLRSFLPGTHEAKDVVVVPADVAPGDYSLELAILDEARQKAHVELAIAGKTDDDWYAISELTIRN